MLRRIAATVVTAAVTAAALTATLAGPAAGATTGAVSISGTQFRVDGAVPYAGTAAAGMLLNSRMTNAIFDDENPATVGNWAYPDTGTWSAERNVTEFVAAVPSYAAKGLRAVTINLQGGNPMPGCSCNATHAWITTAYTSTGALKSAWMSRADRAIRAASANGIVVVLGIMYHGQDQRLADEAAVLRATDNVTDWVLANGYSNVLIEIAGEGSHDLTSHSIVRNRVHELIKRVQDRSGRALKVSTGFTGGAIPPEAVIAQADYVLLHGNGTSAATLAGMVTAVKATNAYKASPKPIMFNEDTTTASRLATAVNAGAGWGYHDKGENDYITGFQTPPVNWGINTATKRAFFDQVATYVTTPSPSPSPSPTPTPTSSPPPSTRSIVVSTSANRAAPQPLDGLTVSGRIYVFTTPDTGVSRVSFHIDDAARARAPYRTESSAPFDLAGGNATTATAFETATLPDGAHTVTAAFTLTGGGTEVRTATMTVRNTAGPALTVSPTSLSFSATQGGSASSKTVAVGTNDGSTPTFSVSSNAAWLTVTPASASAPATLSVTASPSGLAPGTHSGTLTVSATGHSSASVPVSLTVSSAGGYALLVSTGANRASPQPLDGRTVSGGIYVFTGPDTGVQSVAFYIDDPNRTRTPYRNEGNAPFDLAGGEVATAKPYNTAALTVGTHTVTAALTLSAGGTSLITATFTVTR